MAHQSPLISIPKKTTNDADYTNPIRSLIAHSYGEDPKNYAEECSVLQRCRQDAVKGAGSDQTARDLLYKYFGQLELLELRFAEIKVAFHWNDAFTEKGTTQSSLAFEKASIIHLLSSVLSSLAASQSRSDPEGLKRAYSNTRAAAGMLTYINDNFLHAPSTDLSREVVHFCIGIMTAQSTEIFTEKLVDEKKSPALIARSANSAAAAYAAAVEEMKEFQGKGVLDRNWLYVLQIKAKLFASVAQYYRALADGTSGKHGHSLVRLRVADAAAQDAQRQAGGFAYSFVASATPSLPSDAATSLVEITKAHAAIVKEAKDQASKDNDLIYHDVLPTEAALPAIEKLPSAQPITIQELYQSPEVSKLIGPDIFIKLVPLAVHESASVYSEEKAKLVRAEVERTESAEVEVRSALEHLGLPAVLGVWRGLVDDDVDGEDAEISTEIRRLAEDVQRTGVGSIENQVRGIDAERERRERELSDLNAQLDAESRDCERMRAKHAPHFTQPPSAPQTAHYRNNITSNLQSLSAAASSDANVAALWREIQPQLAILAGGMANLERIAKDVAAGKRQEMPKKPEDRGLSLLDLDDEEPAKVSAAGSGIASEEKEQIKKALQEARDKLDRLGRVRGERDEVLKDLKEKVSSESLLHKCIYGILMMWIQNDDVSNLLLANRRQQAVEPQLFATELEKFRPYQSRIASAIAASNSILAELEMLVRQVERGKGYKERSRSSKDKTRRLADWERGLRDAGEGWEEVRSGLQKGRMYYDGLGDVVNDLQREVGGWKSRRERERENMVREIEVRGRLSSTASPPPLPGPPSAASGMGSGTRGLDSQFASMGLGHGPTSPPPRPGSTNYSHTPYPAPPSQASSPAFPPPPPTKPLSPVGAGSSNPYDFSSLSGLPSAFQSAPSPSAPGPSYPSSSGYPAAPPRPTQQPAYPTHLPPSQSSSSSYQSSYPSAPSPYGAPPAPSASAYPPPPPQQPPRQSSASSYPSQPPPAPQAPLSGGYGYQPPSSGYAAPPQQSEYQAYPPLGGHAAHAYHQQAPPPSQYPGHPPQPPAAPQGQQYGAYAQPPPQQHGGYYGGYGR